MGTTIKDAISELKQRKKSFTYKELVSLMKRVGCEVKQSRKEGCAISHPLVSDFIATVAEPHGRSGGKNVKLPYVNNCIRLLERVIENGG